MLERKIPKFVGLNIVGHVRSNLQTTHLAFVSTH